MKTKSTFTMRRHMLCILCSSLLVLSSSFVSATVRTVSNNPLGSAQYNDVQSAVNAANAGDTIYINGSGTAYNPSGVTLSIPLVFIGTGYADSAEGQLNSIISGAVT
ncbi:MAG: hypothetical protein ACLQQ4_16205 [Bacteroidia bacterium]